MEGMNVAGKKILVTGGTGFVGSHLVEALVREGASVVVLYRSMDPRSYFALQNLSGSVIMAIGDLKDRSRITDVITKYEVEYILHLGAQPIVETAYHNPVETIETNVLGTAHILDAAWQSGTVRGIIITSSDKAYGKSKKPYTESDALRADHPYDASKAAADLVTLAYIKTYKAPAVIVRFGNIYGPGDLNFSRIIPGTMKSAITGKTLKVRSDGTFIRDYVYVSDVVSAYLFLLSKMSDISGEVYNISTDTTLSVVDLIGEARKVTGKDISYTIENTQQNEIPYQHLDWKKIRSLGWKPVYTLGEGLKETYEWYKDNRKVL